MINKVNVRDTIYSSLGKVDQLLSRRAKHIILCYHSVADDSNRFSVNKSEFEQQILELHTSRQHMPMLELVTAIGNKQLPEQPTFTLTFDDGYKDVLAVCPFLRDLSIKPTMYILPLTAVPNYEELGTKFEMLTLEDIKSLLNDGWEIGCHSYTHADFAKLSATALATEISAAKEQLQTELGTEILGFSFPKGKYTSEALDLVKTSGYMYAVTMDDNILSSKSDLFTLPRIGVDRSHTLTSFANTSLPSNIYFRSVVKSLGFTGL